MFFIRYFDRIREESAAFPAISFLSSSSPAKRAGSFALRSSSAPGSPVSTTVPEGRTRRIDRRVWYAFCATPQHMPLALFERIPPSVQVALEAGSGPIFTRYGFSVAFTAAPIIPGCAWKALPSSRTEIDRQCWATSTRIPSVTDCPERLVPAARNVRGTPRSWLRRNSACTSSSDFARTTTWGTRR